MMEENSDQYTKNILNHLSGAIHLVRAYLMTDISTPSLICSHLEQPPFAYLISSI